MIDLFTLLQSIIKFINPSHLINKLAFLTFPIWILYRFFPSNYLNVKNSLLLTPKNLNDLIYFINYIINVLLYINYIVIFLLLILMIASIIQNIIKFLSSLFGIYISSSNNFRKEFAKLIIKLFVFFSIYIVSISMYSDLFISYNTALKIIYRTNAYWVSVFPFSVFIIIFVLAIISPLRD